MGEITGIAWTDHTFNPWIGCTRWDTGCVNCYAEQLATTRLGRRWGPGAERRATAEANWKLPRRWARKAAAVGARRRVFCASLADVLDDAAPPELQARLWQLIRETAEVSSLIWLGTSCADQPTANKNVSALLLAQGFQVLWVSYEPAVGPVDFSPWLTGWTGRGSGLPSPLATALERLPDLPRIGWVIGGGESDQATRARPCRWAWLDAAQEQCAAAGVPYFRKQAGSTLIVDDLTHWRAPAQLLPDSSGYLVRTVDRAGADPLEWPPESRVRQFPEVRRAG